MAARLMDCQLTVRTAHGRRACSAPITVFRGFAPERLGNVGNVWN